MEIIKHLIKILLTIVEKAGPTVATIAAAVLAYRFAKKQKLFENKNEDYKKIRKVCSNLLQIWRELSLIEFYAASDDVFANMVFNDSKVAANYFQIDVARIENLKKLFNESAEELKSINAALFFNLESNFQAFHKSFNYFILPEEQEKAKGKELKELIENVLKAVVRTLEDTIKETANHLPEVEKTEIEKIIQGHHAELKKTDFDYEVPKFIMAIINKLFRVIEPITGEEMKIFTSDHTVKMLVSKLAPFIIPVFITGSPMETLSNAFELIKNPASMEGKVNENDFLLKLEISEDENRMLQNNLAFYKLICAIHKKFKKPIPMEFKRELIMLNNGKVDLRKELEEQKVKIRAAQNISKS